MPDILVSEDAKLVGVRLPNGDMALNQARPSRFTRDNWEKAYLVGNFTYPPRQDGGEAATTHEDRFTCEDGVCSIALNDGRTLAYTNAPEMGEVACNIGDIVILAIPGKMLSCKNPRVLMISRQQLALFGALEIRLGVEDKPLVRASNIKPAHEVGHSQFDEASTNHNPELPNQQANEPIRLSMSAKANVLTGAQMDQSGSGNAIDHGYNDQLTFAVGSPDRPWHRYRIYSRAARGLPDSSNQKRTPGSSLGSTPLGSTLK